MRETKKKRWPLFVVVGLLFILLIFAVDGIQRRFIYNDRTVQLQAYYGQLDSVITHRFNRHYRLLTSWTYHLKHKEESGIANFSHYIEMEQRIWDVEDIYLLNGEGRYWKIGGRGGESGLSQENLEKFDRIGTQQVVRYTTADGKRQDLFILTVNPGTFMGFKYKAIAMGIGISQMKTRMAFGTDEFNGTENYLTDADGNMLMCSVSKWKEQDNILDYLDANATVVYGNMDEIIRKVKARESGSSLIEIAGSRYYLTYLPCHTLQTMLICLTPSAEVEAGMAKMRVLNDSFLLLAFTVVMILIFLIFRYLKMQDILAVTKTANDTKTKFLANMSHDFRTPMNAMSGYLTLIKENADDPEKVKEYQKKAETARKNMMAMISSVLELSKMEVGGNEVRMTEFVLDDLINSVMNEVEEFAARKNQKISVSRDKVKENVFFGDREKIETIINNLLHNAITYTKDYGVIILEFDVKGETPEYVNLQIKVIDNGIGMSKEFVEHAFEPFEREQRQNASKEQGTGLGLAVTKNLVEMMGGTIEVNSTPDLGTTFTVLLKLDIPEKTEAEKMVEIQETIEKAETQKPEEAPDDNPFKDMKFLAAEDNELNAEILVEILNMKEAAFCDVAEDGKQALEMFKKAEPNHYDMILMDIQMPNMNGYEAAAAIRAMATEGREDAGHIPILAMSANAFKDDIDKTSESGMDAHIPKPIDNVVFASTVRALKARGHIVS